MKNLNFKKMATEMSFYDKAQIIFADWNLRKQTEEKERLLSPQEEEAMMEDMQKKKQIREFNQLIGLYNMSNMLAVDLQVGIVSLKLAIANVHWLAFAIYLHGQAQDQLEELLYLINARNTKKAEDLKKKMKNSKFDEFLSILNHNEEETEKPENNEPNLHLQGFFERLIYSHKALQRTLYMMDSLLEKAGIDFLSKEAKELIEEAQKEIKYVEDLGGLLSIINIYKKYMELGLIRRESFNKPSFFQLILDYKKVLQLTEEEKEEAEELLETYISKQK